MKLFKTVDDKLKDIGFVKTKENNIDEFYEMTRENYDKLYNEKYYKYVRRKIK